MNLSTPVNLPPFNWQRAFTVTAWSLLAATALTLLSQVRTLVAISEIVDTAFVIALFVACAIMLAKRAAAPAATPPSTPATPSSTTTPQP